MKKILSFALALLATAVVALAQATLQYRVDTVADLVAITLYGSDAKVVAWVGGGSARDDGLGGVFFYDGTSSVSTNAYYAYKPTNNDGRWFKLPTQVANQNSAVTASDETTYAWKLFQANQTNSLSIGAGNSDVYIQSWSSKSLNLNANGNNLKLGNGTANVIIGPSGTAMRAIYSATASLDYPSILANSTTNLTLTVTGAGTNSTVSISAVDGTGAPYGIVLGQAWVSATNTVTVKAANVTVGAIDPAAIVVRATVTQY